MANSAAQVKETAKVRVVDQLFVPGNLDAHKRSAMMKTALCEAHKRGEVCLSSDWRILDSLVKSCHCLDIQEGILIKEVTSPYLVASRSKHWFKLKSDSECHVSAASLCLLCGFGQCAKVLEMTLIWCPHTTLLMLFTFCKTERKLCYRLFLVDTVEQEILEEGEFLSFL